MKPFSHEDYRRRVEKIIRRMPEKKLDFFVVEDSVNLLYLTGLDFSAGRLVVDRKGATLLVDGRYAEAAENNSPFPVAVETDLDVGVISQLLTVKRDPLQVGFLANRVIFSRIERWVELADKQIKGEVDFVAQPEFLLQIREVKEDGEVERLQEAADLVVDLYNYLLERLEVGIEELELRKHAELFCIERGGSLGFEPIIAFGPNSSRPHGRPTKKKLEENEIVQLDLGVQFNYYQSDMSRVHFFGEVDPEMAEIYKVVHQAQRAALEKCRPAQSLLEVDRAARGLIESKGFGDYFPHSLGHGVGLEVHENPVIRRTSDEKAVLREGMVITIEPGIYLPAKGGVRIEDTIVITHDGYRCLTEKASYADL